MAVLCRFLTLRLNRKVVDKTGITGLFDIIDVFHLAVDSTLTNISDERGLGAPDPTTVFRDGLQKPRLETGIDKGRYGIHRDRSHRAAVGQLMSSA
jgi:hypothetical protein